MSADACPNCDAAVPDGARRCLSCYAGLTDGAGSRWASGSDTDSRLASGNDADGSADDGEGDTPGGEDATADGDALAAAVDDADDDPAPATWESRPATVAVAVVGGGIVGAVALASLLLGLAHWSAVPLALIAWLATTVHLSRRERTRRAVAHACYAVAFALLTLPLFWFGPAPEGGDLAGRALLAVLSLLAVGLVAGPLAGVGYWVGQG